MPTILVADDNTNIQKMVGLALKDQGVDVVTVGNGEAAVRRLAEVNPDLILADIFMPVRNGYEVCEIVKHDARYAHIPVVLLVGAFDPLDEDEVKRCGADGVLKKPFVPPEPLIAAVKSLLEKSQRAAANGQGAQLQAPAAAPVTAAPEIAAPAAQEFVAGSTQAAEPQDAQAENEEFEVTRPTDYSLLEQPEAFGSLLEAQVGNTDEIRASDEPETPVFQGANLSGLEYMESQASGENSRLAEVVAPKWDEGQAASESSGARPYVPDVPAEIQQNLLMTEETQEITPLQAAPAPELITGPGEWLQSGGPSTGARIEETAAPWDAATTPENADEMKLSESAIVQHEEIEETPLLAPETSGWAAESPIIAEQETPGAESSAAEPEAEAYLPEASWQKSVTPAAGTHESLNAAAAVFMEDAEADSGPAVSELVSFEPQQALDMAVVDAVVAKVLERLSPQVLEQITREVLRPLAEELVKREAQKKQ